MSMRISEHMAGLMADERAVAADLGDSPSQSRDSSWPQQVIVAEELHPFVTAEAYRSADIVGLVEE